MEYRIGNCFGYCIKDDYIQMGWNDLDVRISNLTDDELLEIIGEQLQHEHIHRAICKNIGNNVSAFFDVIEHKMVNKKLHRKLLKGTTCFYLHADIIKRDGLECWFNKNYSNFGSFNKAFICAYFESIRRNKYGKRN